MVIIYFLLWLEHASSQRCGILRNDERKYVKVGYALWQVYVWVFVRERRSQCIVCLRTASCSRTRYTIARSGPSLAHIHHTRTSNRLRLPSVTYFLSSLRKIPHRWLNSISKLNKNETEKINKYKLGVRSASMEGGGSVGPPESFPKRKLNE